MGKSNKKIKNERVNAIRKQYDAFLEEDKKRRERNEYILDQLDKMRSSSALVPILTKVNYHNTEVNSCDSYVRSTDLKTKGEMEMRNSRVPHLNVITGVSNNPIDELHILKEISKKYILIPKRATPIEKDYCYIKDKMSDDWKSKYNILDDLKKREKDDQLNPVIADYRNDNNKYNEKVDLNLESNVFNTKTPENSSNSFNHFDVPVRDETIESRTMNKVNNDYAVEQDKVNKQVIFNIPDNRLQDSKEMISIPVQNAFLSDADVNVERQSVNNVVQENTRNPRKEEFTDKEKYYSERNEKQLTPDENLSNNSQKCEITDGKDPTVYQENVNSSDYSIPTVDNMYISPENIKADVVHALNPDQTIPNEQPQEKGIVAETVQLDQNIGKEPDLSDLQDLTGSQRVELNDDLDINPEGQITAKERNFDKPSTDEVQNIIPVDLEDIQHKEHVEHESEINEFEAEQKEMFYSEQTDPDTNAYNQDESNIGEYPNGYEQNDQYAYYEGIQQEQAYATNINEHEEATERYDPHYNQQYEGSYENQPSDNIVGYEDSNTYEQQQYQNDNQQYENVANYENQQENEHLYQQENDGNINDIQDNVLPQDEQLYDQHLYAEQPGTQEHIEQQLTIEEGYIETTPVITDVFQNENIGEVEKVIDTISPEESMDPNLDQKPA